MPMTDEELKEILTEFGVYLNYVYSFINTPNATPLQMRLADIIQEAPSRLILEAARGVGKSWITAVYASWRLLRDKNEKVLIVSANTEKAKEIASFLRRLFSVVPILKHLEPSKEIGAGTDRRALKYRDSATAFDVKGCDIAIAPSVAVVGISGQLTGKRATLIIADDVEVPKNSFTSGMREKLINQVKEFEALLIPDKPSTVLFLGTPQSMESIYNKLPYETIVLPAMVPDKPELYNGKLDPWILLQGPAGTPTDKIRFPTHILEERKAGYGLAGFRLQYMLDTTLSDANKFPLKFKDMITYPLDREEAPATLTYVGTRDYIIEDISHSGFTHDFCVKPLRVSSEYFKYDKKIIAIDPSGRGSDETTYAILGVLNGNVFLLDVGGTRDGYSSEALLFLAQKAKDYKVHELVIEKNFGDGMFLELLRPVLNVVYPVKAYEVSSKGQKEVRIIDIIEPLTSNHKLIINQDIFIREYNEAQQDIGNMPYTFTYQFSHITKERKCLEHDDRLDAVAIGCAYLQNLVSISAEEALEQYKDEMLQKFLDEKIYGASNNTSNNNFLKKF